MKTLSDYSTQRYSTKAFDATRKLTEAQIAEIKTLLQYTPSSTNSQPWHFVIANTDAGKALIAQSTDAGHSFNSSKVLDASHVIVLCSKAVMDDAHLQRLLAQETLDGRLADEKAKQSIMAARRFYTNAHRFELRDMQHWMEKQTYIALGNLLLGASVLGIDACPIEGFNNTVLNEVLNLHEKGYTASVLVALGYASDKDFNKNLPKSRFPQADIFTEI